MKQQESIVGTLDKVVYRNEENGFSVLKVSVNSKRQVTVTGYLPALHSGEYVSFEGSWGFHQKFGQQFVAVAAKSKVPENVMGIKKYLGSGLIKGIGPKFAERLVNHFKEKTLEVIDQEPDRLLSVDGVGPRRVQLITDAWQEQKDISKIMVFLHSHEISTSFAVKIYKTYGNDSVEVIQEDPYKLAEDIWGVGFKTADKLALTLDIDPASIRRVRAGILHVIAQVVDKGSLYVEVSELKKLVCELLNFSHDDHEEIVKIALRELYNQDKIKLISFDDLHYITLPQYYFSEKGIANKIAKLQGHPAVSCNLDHAYKMVRLPDSNNVSLNEDQQRGIISCLQNKISIITGGPGTGKTTLVKKLLDVLEKQKFSFRLAAPTGRAAKRMFLGTGRNSETLHRLLEFTPSVMNFTRNEQNALEIDFLIVDEASMIDVFLMNALLRAVPMHAHLVLLGDVDQLPSVGAGDVLCDLIDSTKVSVIRLTEIFRQARDSMIIVNAHNINNGEFPMREPNSDFVFIKEQDPENIFALLRDIYKKRLPASKIPASESIVLTPMNRGIVGTQRLNQELQLILNNTNNEQKQVSRFGSVYKVGDRVMQVRNNYTKFVFNGDIGEIVDVNPLEKKVMIRFDVRTLEYDFGELDEIMHSYAVSIHKSQGSEFSAVIIPIFMQHFILLQRNLIYTAVTRAKKLCILIGQPKAIAIGVKNNKVVERLTFLEKYLTTDLEAR
jgi:exodeoxyribonuclease V alpha subunit